MQYWKGERLVKGSQRYKEDENRKKQDPLGISRRNSVGTDASESWLICTRPCRQIWCKQKPCVKNLC